MNEGAPPPIDYSKLWDVYDAIVQFDEDIPYFLEECRVASGPVLELMAGTGRVSVPLLEAGIDLTCVDYSSEMLDILHQKLSDRRITADLVHQDVRRLSLPNRYDLAFMPFHSFAELTRSIDQEQALAAVLDHLVPGGHFICTLHNPTVRRRKIDSKMHMIGRQPGPGGRGEIVLSAELGYDRSSGIVRGIQVVELIDEDGTCREERRIPIEFALIEHDTFVDMAEGVGFKIESTIGDYGRAPFDASRSPYMIFQLFSDGGSHA